MRENEEKTRKVGGTEKFSRLTFTRLTVSLVREVELMHYPSTLTTQHTHASLSPSSCKRLRFFECLNVLKARA